MAGKHHSVSLGGKNIDAYPTLFDDSFYPFLRHSPGLGGVFCAPCIIFNYGEKNSVYMAFKRLEPC